MLNIPIPSFGPCPVCNGHKNLKLICSTLEPKATFFEFTPCYVCSGHLDKDIKNTIIDTIIKKWQVEEDAKLFQSLDSIINKKAENNNEHSSKVHPTSNTTC